MRPFRLLILAAPFVIASCASTGVDMEQASRVTGKDNDVRVDAQFTATEYKQGSTIGIVYEVENMRDESIAIAELTPELSYDEETTAFTVVAGSEVPGNEMVPRLIEIKPGARMKFTAGTRLILPATRELRRVAPTEVRLKVVYLQNVEPFRKLIGIGAVAIHDRTLADQLFPLWIENSGTVTTNGAPIRWGGTVSSMDDPASLNNRLN